MPHASRSSTFLRRRVRDLAVLLVLVVLGLCWHAIDGPEDAVSPHRAWVASGPVAVASAPVVSPAVEADDLLDLAPAEDLEANLAVLRAQLAVATAEAKAAREASDQVSREARQAADNLELLEADLRRREADGTSVPKSGSPIPLRAILTIVVALAIHVVLDFAGMARRPRRR